MKEHVGSNFRGGNLMAFSKSRKRGSEQSKSMGKMSREPTSGLGSIVEASLSDESQNQIIDGSHDFASISNSHTGSIFMQGDIAAVV